LYHCFKLQRADNCRLRLCDEGSRYAVLHSVTCWLSFD